MKITNIEKIKAWTPPGNPSVNPIVTEVEIGILDYTFDIRYQGHRYEMIVLRDKFDRIGKFNRYRIAFKNAAGRIWETLVYENSMYEMREFYDVLHTMLYRISQGTFSKHYTIN